MKIIYILIAISVIGCKGRIDKKELPSKELPPNKVNVSTPEKFNTFNQDVWFDEKYGEYHLQTYILTNAHDQHPKSNGAFWVGGGASFSPYYHEIKGTFDEIKNKKAEEYKIAVDYLKNKAITDSIIKANVSYLNQLKP